MARKYYTDLDLDNNQLAKARAENLATAPAAGNAGRIIFNTATAKIEVDGGASFAPLASEAYVNGAVSAAGGGDMVKATYDTNNDGVVDAAASAPWAGITGKPATFPPDAHDQLAATITDLNATVQTIVAAYFDTVAGTDANVDTLREILDLVLANETALNSVVRRFNADIGDGTATSIAVAHGLGSLDVTVEVFEKATGATVGVDVVRTNTNTVTIGTSAPLAANSHRIVVKY